MLAHGPPQPSPRTRSGLVQPTKKGQSQVSLDEDVGGRFPGRGLSVDDGTPHGYSRPHWAPVSPVTPPEDYRRASCWLVRPPVQASFTGQLGQACWGPPPDPEGAEAGGLRAFGWLGVSEAPPRPHRPPPGRPPRWRWGNPVQALRTRSRQPEPPPAAGLHAEAGDPARPGWGWSGTRWCGRSARGPTAPRTSSTSATTPAMRWSCTRLAPPRARGVAGGGREVASATPTAWGGCEGC